METVTERRRRLLDIALRRASPGTGSEESRERTRNVFRRWYPDALEDLESLITLGELELQDPDS